MREQNKRYTAQEIRNAADGFIGHGVLARYNDSTQRYGVREIYDRDINSMLRQAADAEEENAKLRVSEDLYKGASENWERRARKAEARMEAVVRECESIKSHYENVVLSQLPVTLVVEANRILRAARGEGVAE